MQQRLQIARNLVSSPRLIFMDEPKGGLDVSVQAHLLDLLRGLVRELQLAVVIVTPDLAVARLLAVRMMVMRSPRVVVAALTAPQIGRGTCGERGGQSGYDPG